MRLSRSLELSLALSPLRAQLLQESSDRLTHDPRRLRVGVAADQVAGDRIDPYRARIGNRLHLGFDVLRRYRTGPAGCTMNSVFALIERSAALTSPLKPGVSPTQPRPHAIGR